MIKAMTCVTVTCDVCGETHGDDFTLHFDSREAAWSALVSGREDSYDYDEHDRRWSWSEDSQVCPCCVQEQRQRDCAGHDWEDEPPPLSPDSPLRFRHCSLCNKHDSSRDEGRTWISEGGETDADRECWDGPHNEEGA